jgi:hypothetical protein
MVFSRAVRATVVVGSAVLVMGAMVGCDSGDPAGNRQQGALELLKSDVAGSIDKCVAELGKAKSATFTSEHRTATEAGKSRGNVVLGGPLTAELTDEDPEEGPRVIRMIGDVMYFQLSKEEQATFPGKHWMRVKMDELGDEGAVKYQDIIPAEYVKFLTGFGPMAVVGEETAGGVKAMHYSIKVPKAQYLEKHPAEQRSAVEITVGAATEVTLELWIDEKYLLRKVRTVEGEETTVVEYTAYDQPVSVQAPEPADMVDFDEVMASVGG